MKSALMASSFIPNSIPATGPTSTRSSARSKSSSSFGCFKAQRHIRNVWVPTARTPSNLAIECWALDVGRFLRLFGEWGVPGGPRGLQNRCRSGHCRNEVGSIPTLSASLFLFLFVFSKGGELNVARANPQAHIAFVLRWLSSKVEPTGPGASFASATTLSESRRSR